MPTSLAHKPILTWYDDHRRALPWREPGVGSWPVLVSEVMLQQTPVARVLPVYESWLLRWPTPSALATEAAGEAVRMWGRLGYPRRALRLHAAARVIDEQYDGRVPALYEELCDLPGVGDYTAAAVMAFAHRQRAPVLDTNVRRVLGRLFAGNEFPTRHLTRSDRELALDVLPHDGDVAATWSVAVMELGALVCTSRAPDCSACPVAALCAWRGSGYPRYDGPPRRGQTYAGTDRQCRGRILAMLRANETAVPRSAVETVWGEPLQRERALMSLLDDGLVVERPTGSLALP